MEQGIIEQLVNAIKQEPNDKKTTYSAIVSRIDEEGVIWVYVAGADKDTPTAQTGVEVKKGDNVTVEWRNNKLYIAGNYSNPSAGVFRVQDAEIAAKVANEAAANAVIDAGIAREAAQDAKATADNVRGIAEDAQRSADSASESAELAKASADTAITQLSIVEDVVGVLDLISKNGRYELTQDIEVVPDKWYFTRQGEGTEQSPYVYTVVNNPQGNPSDEGWYELTGIDEAIRNYVSSHLVIDNNGLWLQKDGVNSRLQLHPSEGLLIHGSNGKVIGKYGQTAQIGDSDSFHIEIDGTELGFYEGANKVAYISNHQLYITQSVVLQQMDLGLPIVRGGLGQWSWKVHANHENHQRNNLNLKWIG